MPYSSFYLIFFSLITLFLFNACAIPRTASYQQFYAHLLQQQTEVQFVANNRDEPFYLLIFVDARHLDYTENYSFLKTIAKHPSDGSKNRDFGHAWILLHGEGIEIEGGHSGESGLIQPKYFDGIMNYLDYGYVEGMPTVPYRYEPNPIKYLWEVQHDGFFQYGSGGHKATYGVKITLDQQRFETILTFIYSYPFKEYAITKNQCSSFATQVAQLAGIDLISETTIDITPTIRYRGANIRLWSDPTYSQLTISSPDILEKSLMQAVAGGKCVQFRKGI